MTLKFPVIELFDRLAIAKIKFARTGANLNELQFYENQIHGYDLTLVSDLLQELATIHAHIWDLEKELKSGREQDLPLAEIGRRAIEIRDWNNKRISIKNLIAAKLQDDIFEIKKDHLSASDINKK
jgi:hypothetical protein